MTPLTRVIFVDKSQKILQADEIKYFIFVLCQETQNRTKRNYRHVTASWYNAKKKIKINLTDKKIRKRKEDNAH